MANSFTAVDLSRLPAPQVVEELDVEGVYVEMRDALSALLPDLELDLESDPINKLLQVCAYREVLLRKRVNDAARANMLAYAQKGDLDNLGALLGVSRLMLDPGDAVLGIEPTMESDTDFRRRIQLSPEGFSVAGPEGAYIYHALSSSPEAKDASATSPEPGDVVVTVLSRIGDGMASQELIDRVMASLSAESVRPMTDRVTVQGAEIISYAVRAVLYTFSGPDSSVVIAEALRRLEDYVAESHRIGRDVPLSALYAQLHAEGVQRVVLLEPTADIVVDRTQAAHCGAIELSNGGQDE